MRKYIPTDAKNGSWRIALLDEDSDEIDFTFLSIEGSTEESIGQKAAELEKAYDLRLAEAAAEAQKKTDLQVHATTILSKFDQPKPIPALAVEAEEQIIEISK